MLGHRSTRERAHHGISPLATLRGVRQEGLSCRRYKRVWKRYPYVLTIGIHAELSRSAAAASYCNKEDTRVGEPFEVGAKPFRRNSKTDWESVWSSAKSGDLESIPPNVRVVSYRTLRAIGADYSVALPIDRRVDVFWGSTGTGKSRRAWTEAGEGIL